MMLTCDYSDGSEQTSRKFAKTCVEKKRRDRINKSLDELKDLMALTDERARYQKLEKAEILEMTVNYIRNLKRTMNSSVEDYENGYRQCSEEMWKLIHSIPNILPDQRERLANRCRQMWTNRRYTQQQQHLHLQHHHHHPHHSHPYQRRPVPTEQYSPHHHQQSPSSCLKILVNHSSIINSANPSSSLPSSSSSSSTASSNSLSPSSPKLWKPYM